MTISAIEISDLIKKKIQEYDLPTEARTEGTVVSLTDGIARIHGLSDVMQGEMIEFPGNVYGLALNLERDSVGAVIMGAYEQITEGDIVRCTKRILEVPVGESPCSAAWSMPSATPWTARDRSRPPRPRPSRRSPLVSSPESP